MAILLRPADEPDAIVMQLYDGVTCPDDWYAALDALRRQMGADCFHSFEMRRADRVVLGPGLANIEVPAEKVREYETHHAANDMRMALTRLMPLGAAVADHDYFGTRAIARSPIYMDWLRPVGLRYTLAMSLRLDDEVQEVLGFIRGRDAPPYDAQTQARCRRYLPHIVRASALRERMARLSAQALLGLSALDALPQGIAVLDAGCRLQHLNPHGRALTGADGPWTLTHGRLAPRAADDRAAFEALVRHACAGERERRAGTLRLRAGGETVGVSVIPIKAAHPLAAARQMPLALVVARAAAPAIEPQALGELLGLTPTEARLALLLAAGKTVKDFAAIEGCSWHTARTHAKNLLRKSGCHRQAEVVQLVQSLRGG